MKKLPILLIVLLTVTINTNAQIPNSGFEEWTIQSEIEIPIEPWATNNLQKKPTGVTYNPVTKSTDHYPTNVGNYSIRMENNISYLSEEGELLPYWACSYGYSTTAFYPGYNGPVFPITGHPNSFCGYYKFLPQNNDTMVISITLYLSGEVVSSATLSSNLTVSEWTSFSISLPDYTTADSAQIGFAAFYNELGSLPSGPHGNSILYIDNLNFDNLITGISEQIVKTYLFNLYPNPSSEIVTLNIDNANYTDLTLNIYNVAGKLITSETLEGNKQQINVGGLSNGIYMVEIKTKEWTGNQKLIIQK